MKPWDMEHHKDWVWHVFETWARFEATLLRFPRKWGWVK